MKKIAFKSTILALALLFAAGCSNMNTRQKNTAIGAAIGGVAGNVIGNSTGATLGGAALGGVIGSQIN
ncbi:glycine zipper 2TM domain-containing protein [Testudinibacter sp. TR-2022]|uniref:glycine zipper 2TM domain-containing protein n=1 Tax=Testudinibacter sp. TR-2022 TaxID=2585029 RepID=UPI001119472C|nr:glycine zipper 2TM domain-containing protein [Testudinibacter sp. TR-2022]TNH05449.1 glycine zipper 2TM domain-containing protein [Pasteurellaceae bacterium Phil31]TNH09490.1 glycine zipper 2TM domain-containing protein [Testudinibacter sp. TR-2022]TNH12319.1 glycine zipper 2TM domain-containing protein [Testudinibacter sp. TR-2022]TNH13347.1 glycine zipper 2TM domain-containing protein [Testudinibacter sp. TR-2022]TNH16336.1 glycine zipper 2TM domain-containing protein [Testudinibacter sp.